jgi:acyl-CoA thioesterase-2
VGKALDALLALLDLERIGEDIFRGENEFPNSAMRIFGGQVVAQALAAAARTVAGGRPCHSLHAYFLRPGDSAVPLTFHVERIRDGSSFTTRQVVARQNELAIFHMTASYHHPEESFEHEAVTPDAPGPTSLPSWADRARDARYRIPAPVRKWMLSERPVEIRSSEPHGWFSDVPSQGPNLVWLRASGALGDDACLHQCVFAYGSDVGLVDNIYRPHRGADSPGVMLASLDHAVWFHRPFRTDEWLLYVQESPVAVGARGFVRGAVYTQQGSHVASVTQEGLMRTFDPRRSEKGVWRPIKVEGETP